MLRLSVMQPIISNCKTGKTGQEPKEPAIPTHHILSTFLVGWLTTKARSNRRAFSIENQLGIVRDEDLFHRGKSRL